MKFTLVLTGAENGLDDISLPMSSLSLRRKLSPLRTALSCVVPNVGRYAADISARTDGGLRLSVDGVEVFSCALYDISTALGGNSSSVSLSGTATVSNSAPKTIEVFDATYISENASGGFRVRCGYNALLPADTLRYAGIDYLIATVTLTASASSLQFEIGTD